MGVFSTIVLDLPICYYIQTETRVVVCKTRKLVMQNMPFNTPTNHDLSLARPITSQLDIE